MDEDNVKEHKGRGEYFLLKKSMCGLFWGINLDLNGTTL
jgi:hypothetical protein